MQRRTRNAIIAWGITLSAAMLPFVAHAGPLSDRLTTVGMQAGYNTSQVGKDQLPILIANIVQIAVSIVGLIFFVQMVYAGYLWMTARGEREQLEKAQETIRRSVVGLIIVIAAWSISAFIVKQLEARV